jgi:phage shock protein A
MMARFKRWTRGVVSSIDEFVVQIENHEAQVASALRELEQAVARAKVQLVRVDRDGKALEQSVSDEREAVVRWRERALREPQEARALECLRRHKRAVARARELEQRLLEHQRMEQQLRRDVRALETRLGELREQRNLMRTRQSRADAFGVVQGAAGLGTLELGDVFERWETRVTESEVASGCLITSLDSFEDEFVDAEEEAALKLELQALKEEA